jgi:hypothetical protein
VSTTTDYALGASLHAQVSAVSIVPQSRWWDGAAFAVEFAANHRLDVGKNRASLDPTRTRAAVSLRAAFEPQYFAVWPGLDLTLPMSFGYALAGRSSVNQSQQARVGDIGIGVRFTFRAVWEAGVNYTHFFGPADRQSFRDRDFISLNVQRTF